MGGAERGFGGRRSRLKLKLELELELHEAEAEAEADNGLPVMSANHELDKDYHTFTYSTTDLEIIYNDIYISENFDDIYILERKL